MPKPHKKKQRWSSRYFTRTQSLRKLQLSLKSFRQLCIYKGIHPRVPKRVGGDARVFYHNKDIKFLAHEPAIAVLRRQRQFYKKITAAEQRRDKKEVQRLQNKFPKISLSHMLKERYPTFDHALRDLDDPLTMAHLFANLDQQGNYRDQPELYSAASRLCTEFQAYVAKTNSLRKVFVSVKGYYYQADIMGTLVTWCVPHKFVQNFNQKEIDPFIMTSYMQFYKTMLSFVNFRLFHSIGMKYPLRLSSASKQSAFPLEAVMKEFTKKESKKAAKSRVHETQKDDEELVEIIDEEEEIGEKAAGETRNIPVADDASLCAKLFNGLVFLLGRETPLDQLIFTIRSFGGIIILEDEKFSEEAKESITHCICDRPQLREDKKLQGREYVQPQWVFDSCNARVLLPTELYTIGKKAPPHLSPFVSTDEEGYVPDYAKKIRKIQEAANLVRESNDTTAQKNAINEILEQDVEFQEQEEYGKAEQLEQEYLQELELELETEFPDAPSSLSVKSVSEEIKKRRIEEALEDTQKMEEIMVRKKFQYKKLKHKEKVKKAKIQRLQRKKDMMMDAS
eukprot:g7.t1